MLLLTAVVAACTGDGGRRDNDDARALLNPVAEAYVKLVLAVGQHDADYVDAYYGPAAWRTEAEANPRALEDIHQEADSLLQELHSGKLGRVEQLVHFRHEYLVKQLQSLRVRVDMLSGTRLNFDEESQALYDATAPTHPESHFADVLARLDTLLPGDGPLVDRYAAFREDFVIPKERLDTVFRTAISECRKRTKRYLVLPPNESFVVEYVTDKSWGGYNWYQGNYHSLIQVNTDLPISIDKAFDLACHEGYPGHHTYSVLLEHHLVRGRGWVEFSVYPLFSPQSLIAEGSANYGIEVAFPNDERVAFERDVLFPLAGLDPRRVEEYDRVRSLVRQLAYAGNEAARRYLNGEIDRDAAARWIAEYAMTDLRRAQQRVRFFDQYRSYVINYNLGQDLVRSFVESRLGDDPSRQDRWNHFKDLMASPRLASSLR
ncbi:MAG: hypothetical protein ACE5M4_15380 [Anaerolineales bacterium]